MRINRLLVSVAFFVAAVFVPVNGQIVINEKTDKQIADSIRAELDNRPYFSLYKDIYFVGGTVLGGKPTQYNSDVKFQISFQQRLTKSVLPWNSYLYLFYTQMAMWNVFERSLPFHDLNFNPGIGISRYIIMKNRLIGKATVMIEHESNGRDGEASRSWNKVTFGYAAVIDPRLEVYAKTWIPIIDGQQNKDILKYNGIFQTGAQYISANKRWVADVTFVKRQGWNLNFNTILNVGFRLSRKENQFLMLHFYDGYGENLLDYNKYHMRLRVGLLIRPNFFSDF